MPFKWLALETRTSCLAVANPNTVGMTCSTCCPGSAGSVVHTTAGFGPGLRQLAEPNGALAGLEPPPPMPSVVQTSLCAGRPFTGAIRFFGGLRQRRPPRRAAVGLGEEGNRSGGWEGRGGMVQQSNARGHARARKSVPVTCASWTASASGLQQGEQAALREKNCKKFSTSFVFQRNTQSYSAL